MDDLLTLATNNAEGHEHLAQEFSQALRDMKADGTYANILERYSK